MATIFKQQMAKAIFVFAVICFSPLLINAQTSNIDITVGARVCGTTSSCPIPEEIVPPPPGVGGGFPIFPFAQLIFQGQAYPLANVTILKNDAVISTFKAGQDGRFEKIINGTPSGTFIFSIFAEDSKGRTSPSISVTVPILADRSTLVSGIFIPPTIEVFPAVVRQGENIGFFGEAFPQSLINLLILPKNILLEATSSVAGNWTYNLNTTNFGIGEYTAQAKTTDKAGKQSGFSKILAFAVIKSACRGADLNGDGKVNLVDFSILLYFWGQTNPQNPCVDLNSDGIVDIIDFSIMMYYWTG